MKMKEEGYCVFIGSQQNMRIASSASRLTHGECTLEQAIHHLQPLTWSQNQGLSVSIC